MALMRRLAERLIQLAANVCNLQLIFEAGNPSNILHSLLPFHQQMTFAIKTNINRYHHKMRSELLTFNDQAIRSDICFLAALPNTVVLVADWWIEIKVLLIREEHTLRAANLQPTKQC